MTSLLAPLSVVPAYPALVTGTLDALTLETATLMPPRDRHAAALHHPWRAFSHLVEWTLRWAHLPNGDWGQTDFDRKIVTLKPGMNQAERRCTIAHETQHVLRGPWTHRGERADERAIDRHVARLLLPDVRQLADALSWVGWRDLVMAADELWVDEFVLQARLDSLHPSERAYLRRRFSDWRQR